LRVAARSSCRIRSISLSPQVGQEPGLVTAGSTYCIRIRRDLPGLLVVEPAWAGRGGRMEGPAQRRRWPGRRGLGGAPEARQAGYLGVPGDHSGQLFVPATPFLGRNVDANGHEITKPVRLAAVVLDFAIDNGTIFYQDPRPARIAVCAVVGGNLQQFQGLLRRRRMQE
jgi:hypothetical protein